MNRTTRSGRWLVALMFVCLLGLGKAASLGGQPTPGGHMPPPLQLRDVGGGLAPGTLTGSAPQDVEIGPYTETISGTLVSFEMVPVPGGVVQIADPDGGDGVVELGVGPFWIGKTEVTWDEYDVWMLGLDRDTSDRRDIDAESRPSSPYGAPDRGFGHAGYAAMSLSFHSAEQYALWLAEKTGSSYRLPTAAEWQYACQLGMGAGVIEAEVLEALAWYGGNSSRTTHPVASRAPDRLGLFNILGNVGEWVTPVAGDPALQGGSFLDDADVLTCDRRALETPAWNASDPQIPQSRWWLADAPFAGFRIVRELEEGDPYE